MTQRNGSRFGTNFTVSIEARSGVTTGISAADRAHTIQVAVADDARPGDLVTPGHVFPLRAPARRRAHPRGPNRGQRGVLGPAGCGLKPAAVICEIMKDDGTMARMPDLEAFAEEHGLKIAAKCAISSAITCASGDWACAAWPKPSCPPASAISR